MKITLSIVGFLALVFSFTAIADHHGCQSNVQHVDPSRAIIACNSWLEQPEEGVSEEQIVKSHIQLISLYRQVGDINNAVAHADSIIQLPLIQNNSLFTYLITREIGINYYSSRKYQASLNIFKQALQLAETLDDPFYLAKSYNDLGNLYEVFLDFETASSLFIRAYDFYFETEDQEGMAIVLNNLGNVYRLQKDFTESVLAYRQSFMLHQKLKNSVRAAHTLRNMALSMLKLNQIDKAADILQQAIEVSEAVGDYAGVIEGKAKLADILIQQNQLDTAEALLSTVTNQRTLLESSVEFPDINISWGNFYRAKKQYEKALTYLSQGLAQAKEAKDIDLQERFYALVIQTHVDQTHFEQAYLASEAYITLKQQRIDRKYNLQLSNLNSLLPDLQARSSTAASNNDYIFTGIVALLAFIAGAILSYLIKVNALTKRKAKQYFSTPNATSTPVEAHITHHQQTVVSSVNNDDLPQESTPTSPEHIEEPAKPVVEAVDDAAQELLFRTKLVELMLLCLETWEAKTQKSKIELAEKSQIWKVTIDDGRLRTRALERYLSIDKLPKKPRWREVVRTGHFILTEFSQKDNAHQEEIKALITEIQGLIKQKAVR